MTTKLAGGVLYSIIHQVMGRVVVVEECPGAENSMGPGHCLVRHDERAKAHNDASILN